MPKLTIINPQSFYFTGLFFPNTTVETGSPTVKDCLQAVLLTAGLMNVSLHYYFQLFFFHLFIVFSS